MANIWDYTPYAIDYDKDNVDKLGSTYSSFVVAVFGLLNKLKSWNYGSMEPVDKSPWLVWADTENLELKIRNADNSAWITLGKITDKFGMTPSYIGAIKDGGVSEIIVGAEGARPAASSAGRWYVSHSGRLYRDNGASWDLILSMNWDDIKGKPTTLAGYGITDAVNSSDVVTVATANKILKLDTSGKLVADVTGNISGNAGTATKLAASRKIILSGDASGSSDFDGTGDTTIKVVVSESAHSATSAHAVIADRATSADKLVSLAVDESNVAVGKVPIVRNLSGTLTIVYEVPTGGAGGGISIDDTSTTRTDATMSCYLLNVKFGQKADSEHNHDTSYAAKSHNHDAVYAVIAHNHDSSYAAKSHNHDSVYSVIAHNHDASYAVKSHNHDTSYQAFSAKWSGGVVLGKPQDSGESARNIFPRNGTVTEYRLIPDSAPTASTSIDIYHNGTKVTSSSIVLSSASAVSWTCNLTVSENDVYYAKVNGTSGLKSCVVSVIPKVVNR